MINRYKQVSIKINHAGDLSYFHHEKFVKTTNCFFFFLGPDINLLIKFLNYKVCWKEDKKEVMFFN